MLKAKDTNFLSEISSFFKNNDASKRQGKKIVREILGAKK